MHAIAPRSPAKKMGLLGCRSLGDWLHSSSSLLLRVKKPSRPTLRFPFPSQAAREVHDARYRPDRYWLSP